MKRLLLTLTLAAGVGCASTGERYPLRQLPDDAGPVAFAELLTRARAQAMAGTEAIYINRWSDLEDAARGLEQTARFMGRAADVPAKHKDTLAVISTELGKQAVALREAARSADAEKSNKVLSTINLKVRELRLEN